MSKENTKQAMAQPFSPEVSKDLAGRGVYSIPDVTDEFPKGGKTPHTKILKNTGADTIFGENTPKIRKIYMPKNDRIVSIDGKEYFLMETEKSTKTRDGYFLLMGPVARDSNGKIDHENTGNTSVKVSYNQYKDQIAQSPIELKQKIDMVNAFVDKYNDFVDKSQDKKFGTVTTLPLQIDWAERLIQERIKTLDSMIKSRDDNANKQKETLEKVKEVRKNLTEDVSSGKIKTTPANYVVSILEQAFHSVPTLEELKSKLASLNEADMPFDLNANSILKKYMLAVVDWQIKARNDEKAKKGQEDVERSNRIEDQELDEIRELVLEKIKRVETIPGKYKKSTGYYGPEFAESSKHEADETQERDKDELMQVLATLTRARQTIIDLPNKSNVYITGEGSVRLSQIQAFIDAAKIFIRRYKTDPFVKEGDEVKINPKLFSASTSGLGNSLVSVALRQIILSVEQEIKKITEGTQDKVSPERTEPTKTEKIEQPVTSDNKVNIKKLSSVLWQAFEGRMRIR